MTNSRGNRFVFDIECNDLLEDVSKIHCIVMENIVTGEVKAYHDSHALLPFDGYLSDGYKALAAAGMLAGHNICQYDIPALHKVMGYVPNGVQAEVDTLTLSRMLYPERHAHSLEAWGKTLKMRQQKVQNEDWSELTQNILTRCVADVHMNVKLLRHFQMLIKKHEGEGTNWMKSLRSEQGVAHIHAIQTLNGVKYDWELGLKHIEVFDKELMSLRDKIIKVAPPNLKVHGTSAISLDDYRMDESEGFPGVTKPLKKDGMPSANCVKWFEGSWSMQYNGAVPTSDLVRGQYCKVEFLPINVNSDQQVKKFLYELGWKPDEWNTKKQDDGSFKKTSPKLSESSFGSLPPGVGQDIKRYRMVKHRRGLIQSIKHPETKGAIAQIRADGRVPANAITCGTPTARYRHSGAVCNIPRPTSTYGKEIRELYCVPEDSSLMVGIDLSGIEARMLGHFCVPYPGGRQFAELITQGDWHSENAKLWGCDRNDAKTELYALMYGAGPLKLGNILGKSAGVGRKNRDDFFRVYKPYADLTDALEEALEANGGWIRALDGRRLYVRNKKDVLSSCLQGNAAIIFKLWMNKVHEEVLPRWNMTIKQLIAYHDELQFEFVSSSVKDANIFGSHVVEAAKRVGESLDLKVPIDAEHKVGKSWRDTH